MEVHKAGGGIHFTVDKTREATEEELEQSLLERLGRMLRAGEIIYSTYIRAVHERQPC